MSASVAPRRAARRELCRASVPWLVLLLGALAGCAHFPENRPLRDHDAVGGGYRFENLNRTIANTNSLFVCLSFSGGGTRAAAFALGVVRALRATKIDGGARRLSEEVDVVSAVSGGAFTAAYYGVFGDEKLDHEFEGVLSRALASDMVWRGLARPWNAIRLLSPWFDRSDIAAELYDETIFGGRTYADLQAHGRPYVVLNATNLSLGERFEFTQEEFDLLGSALVDFPVGRAVAASSAFPFLLTPVTLVNHPITRALPPLTEEGGDRVQRARARARKILAGDKEHHKFVHLTDGGVVDNLGLGFLLDSYRDGFLRSLVDSGEISTLVLIVVNARNRVPSEIDSSGRAPGVTDVIVSSIDTAIDRHTGVLAHALEELRDAPAVPSRARVHAIEVNLEDLPDPVRRDRLLAIGTNYSLSPEDVRDVANAGAELLRLSPTFQSLVASLDGTP